jgi:D-beta-D-heptose 7-phosphate kinase/D-beta-D-heptose 1-phosphate adenosyltransferase
MISSTLANEFISRAMCNTKVINIAGDCLIDEYIQVEPKFNPESVFPAFLEKSIRSMPGGAGNVAYQFAHLPIKSQLVGALSHRAFSVYADKNIDTRHCSNSKLTPIKRRYYNGSEFIFRIDREGLGSNIDNSLMRFPTADYNLFSDYNKGFFKANWFKDHLSKAIVDIKPNDIHRWRGCLALKLNAKEAREASGSDDLLKQLDVISKATDCGNIIITMAEKGVAGLDDGVLFKVPQEPVVKRNIIGAGDCFLAFFGYSVLLGFGIHDSAKLATYASSLYVQRSSIKPLRIYDFVKDKLIHDSSVLRDRDFKIVFTNGCFDILHAGHVDYLRFAKSKGDKLVVGVNTDESVRRLKGDGRPVNCLERRLEILKSLDFVDYVVPFEEDTPLELITILIPEVLVKGKPYTGLGDVVGSEIAGEVIIAPTNYDASSSALVEYI